jgi:hypothetical protein
MERIKSILNNETYSEMMFNLYDRWRDEYEYEDIKDYAKVIIDKLTTLFPSYNIKLVKPSKRPFGVAITINGEYSLMLGVKVKGGYLVCFADKIKRLR